MSPSVSWSSSASVESGAWLARERILGRFEEDWKSGFPPDVSAYLGEHHGDFNLLVELAHADLEYRIRFGHEARVEGYLARFPELASDSNVVLDLIETEFRARTRAGRSESVDSYRSRFPSLGDQLSARLSATDEPPGDRSTTVLYVPNKETKIGQVGKFELFEKIGAGGFGAVFRGRDPELDRPVAVKIAHEHRMSDDLIERFLREARASAQLRHPHLLAVFDAGKTEEGGWYIASSYLPGGTLQRQIQKRSVIPPEEAAEWIAQAAEGLQHAHEHGIIHRDVKPANLMLDERGRAQVVDFGLARRPDIDPTMTVEGAVLGTPVYMSPEQAGGRINTMDHRTDVYSLGATLYHLLTGRAPFHGTPSAVIHAVLHDEPESPRRRNRSVPRDVDTIVRKAMSKEAGNRYQTAGELADDLRRWLRGDPVSARPLGPMTRLVRWAVRSPVVAGLTGGLFTAILLGGALFAWKFREAERNLERADERNRAAIKNFVAGEQLADEGRRLMADLLKNGVIDGLEPALLQHLPARLLDEVAGHFETTLRDNSVGRDRAGRIRFLSALACVRRIQGDWNRAEIILRDPDFVVADPRELDLSDRHGLGTALIANGKFSEAVDQFRQTRSAARLQPATPGNDLLILRCAVGEAHAVARLDRDAAGEALRILNDVRSLAEGRDALTAVDPDWKMTLAQYARSRADALVKSKASARDALAEYRRAAGLFAELATAFPNSDDFLIQLAWTSGSLAGVEQQTGIDPKASRTTGLEAITRVVRRLDLRRKTDDSERLRAMLATACDSAGSLLNDLERPDEAEKMHRRGMELFLELEREFHRHGYLRGARGSARNLSRALTRAERFDESLGVLLMRSQMAAQDSGELWQASLDAGRLSAEMKRQRREVPPELGMMQVDL